MNYFTSKAFIVSAKIAGRDGRYGATTSLIGVFNTKIRALKASDDFIKQYNKSTNQSKISGANIDFNEIEPNKINEVILSKIYE